MSTTPRIALVAGATGLVGGFLLKALLDAPEYSRVYALTRRPFGNQHPKLANRVVIFERMAEQLKGLVAQDAFCCLGTTMAEAGSQEAFRAADVDAVLLFARAARAAQATRFVVVSSVGASSESKKFYLRTKGEMEEAVSDLGFVSVDILQPSLLLGPRQSFRFLEVTGQILAPLINPLLTGSREPYRAVSAEGAGVPHPISGRVSARGHTTVFAGQEILLDDAAFAHLQEQEWWPQISTIDERTGPTLVRDKAVPHAAAAFVAAEAAKGQGTLRVFPSVFLPLGEADGEYRCVGRYDYELLLHGYYFVDAGRRQLARDNPWNKELRQKGALRQVLVALQDFVREAQLAQVDICSLTNALATALGRDIADVCHASMWLTRVKDAGPAWELCPRGSYYVIPSPPKGKEQLPFGALPRLKSICDRYVVTLSDAPRLVPEPPMRWLTREGDWAHQILDVRVRDVFASSESVRYLTAFAASEREGTPELLWVKALKPIGALLRGAIAQLGLQALAHLQDEVRSLSALLASELILALPEPGADRQRHLDSLLEGLASVEVDHVLLPAALAPELTAGRFAVRDAHKLLEWLAKQTGTDRHWRSMRSELAVTLLNRTTGSLSEKRAQCGDLTLFRVHSHKEQNESLLTWNELENHRVSRRLFSASPGGATALQQSLRDEKLYSLIESRSDVRAGEGPFGNTPPPQCSVSVCLSILGEPVAVAAPENRLQLLRFLRDESEKPQHRIVIRYLLHGEATDLAQGEPPLFSKNDKDASDVWQRLLTAALELTKQSWRVLSTVLTNELTPSASTALGIRSIDRPGVEHVLSEQDDLAWVSKLELSSEHREDVLSAIEDDALWRRLPLHETTTGELIPISGRRAYLDGGIPVPSVLAERIVLLERPVTPRLTAAYNSHHVEEWDATTAINESLAHEEPWKCAAVIMDALASLSRSATAIPTATLPPLRQVKWLPTSKSEVAPADVVYLPEIAGTVEYLRLTPVIAEAFVYAGDISDSIATHVAFSTVATSLFPDRTASCDVLSNALALEARFRLGVLSDLGVASRSIRTLVSCFESVDESVFAARAVLTEVDVHYGSEALTLFSQPLRTRASLPLTLDRLYHLARRHSDTSVAHRDDVLDVHVGHVLELVTYDDFQPATLKDLELLNRRGRWKSTSRLCLDAPGVNPSDLLHERYAALLHNRLLGANATAQQSTSLQNLVRKELSDDSFRPYWRGWDSVVPSEVVGGFVALLAADDPSVRGLAQQFLGARDLDVFLSGLDRQSAFGTIVRSQVCRLVFDVTDPRTQQTITTLNLLGELFDASIDTEYDNLLIDRPLQIVNPGKHPTFLLRFRQIDPTAHTREELVRILGETASMFLKAVDWAVIANIDEVLNELAETEQLDLAVAQAMIAEMGFFYLRQLGGKSVPSLRPLVMRWDQLRYRREEERIAEAKGKKVAQTADSEMQVLRKDLQQALESTDAQHELLSLVRSRIRDHYQYTLESLPFELFQNADDASVEMTQMVTEADAGSSRIVLDYDDVTLRFAHWGRPINRFRVSGFSAEEGRARGFDRDLEKMLVLSASDKDMGHGEVTGKFGLGFKTVFLLSDSPEVVSDRLAFRVLGGMLPKALEPDRKEQLRQRLAHYGPTSAGTLVELSAAGAKPVEALGRFLNLVHITLAFAHAVKSCEIRHQNGKVERVSWEDRPVKGSEQVRVGLLRPSESSGLGSSTAVLLGGSSCRLLMLLAVGGFKPLPAEVPTIWITAPTSECLDAGVALNARFAPDVGRARLAASPVNDDIAGMAGRELAEAFEALYVTADGWLEHASSNGADNYAVWRSLWEVLTKGDLEASESQQSRSVLKRALWHQGNGYAHLLAQGAVLPSGLSGHYRVLTSLHSTKFVIRGLLTDQATFEAVASWPFFKAYVQPPQAVSADVERTLRKFAPWAPPFQAVTLTQVLNWEVRRGRQVSGDSALRLGSVANPNLLARVARDAPAGEGELTETLREFQFRASDGSWQDSAELLIPYGKERGDEARRAAFAPEKRVAHNDYGADGASDFIDACRGGLRAPSDLLAAWGIAADRLEARKAFLRYLLEGDLRGGVSGHAREQRHATWLDGLPNDPILSTFEESEQLQLLGLLGFVRNDATGGVGPTAPEPPPLRLSARTVLEWWRSEGNHHLPGYLQRLYPNGQRLALGTGASREDWLKLFLLGMAQTLGYARPQASRNFVDLCEREGFLSAFARTQDDKYAWLDLLDEYLGRQVQSLKYHMWLRLLIGLWLVGRGLDEYVAAIDSIDRTSGAISPDLIFNPRTNPNLQGGGPDAPPIAPILGIGCCFVLRELASASFVRNPAVHPYCYVPSAGVRWLVRALGGPDLDSVSGPRWVRSVAIYEFLRDELGPDDATFDGAFDIPLQLLAYDPDLLQRVLTLSAPADLDDESRDEA